MFGGPNPHSYEDYIHLLINSPSLLAPLGPYRAFPASWPYGPWAQSPGPGAQAVGPWALNACGFDQVYIYIYPH